jgi:hypothetical protein
MDVNWTRYVCLNMSRAHLVVRGSVHTVRNLTRVGISTLAPPTGIWYKRRINKPDVKWAFKHAKIIRVNFAPSRDYYVYYVVHTGTAVYPAFYPVGTLNSITACTAIATWGSPPFNLPPPLTMHGVSTSVIQNICVSMWWITETVLTLCYWTGIAL